MNKDELLSSAFPKYSLAVISAIRSIVLWAKKAVIPGIAVAQKPLERSFLPAVFLSDHPGSLIGVALVLIQTN